MTDVICAIDAGTTGVTVLLMTPAGQIAARGYSEFEQHFPESGWVEHDLEQVWAATKTAGRQALASSGGARVVAIGITNQRETVGVWNRETLKAPRRAIVWQDRRTAKLCRRLRADGHEQRVADLTGLRLDPYFSATKLRWLVEHDDAIAAGLGDGSLVAGTIDSYVIARLTRGASHVTDASNASRTLLCDTRTATWSPQLCELFGTPVDALPDIRPSWGEFGTSVGAEFLGISAPITGVAGDQQAALFGQACFDVGDTKVTYGTGSFVLTNTGTERSDAIPGADDDGLLTTIAWTSPGGEITYAREGSIFVTGSAVQWLRDGLGVVQTADDVEALAAEAGEDSGGVVFVPALTGLGAPHWNPDARGTIVGLSRGTTKAHLARATLDAICCQVRDVMGAGERRPKMLRVDGGASANDLLMQLQADHVGLDVERPTNVETTGKGAAMLAGLGAGMYSDLREATGAWHLDTRFSPRGGIHHERAEKTYRMWAKAVELTGMWHPDE